MMLTKPFHKKTLSATAVFVTFLTLFLLYLFGMSTFSHTKTQVLQSTHARREILSTRSEYYFLNRGFFTFLAQTNMECHIQVRPGHNWSSEASVKMELLDEDSIFIQEYGDDLDDANNNNNNLMPSFDVKSNRTSFTNFNNRAPPPRKYILVYRHFEQLGKTVENLIQLAAIAKSWGRSVVRPNVKNSRFTMEPGSDSYPMNAYFDVNAFNLELREAGCAQLVDLSRFLRHCKSSGGDSPRQIGTTLVHFLYNDYYKGNTKLWYNLNETVFEGILQRTLTSGWTECAFIDKYLGISNIFKGIRAGRQLCVNPEVLRNEDKFGRDVLKGDKCVIFIEWRGLGSKRTHFSLKRILPFFSSTRIQHSLTASNVINQEVITFKKSNLRSKMYISVHLRTERMFGGHTFERFQLCLEHIVHVVGIVRELRGEAIVFLATDMTQFGTDAYDHHNFYTTNATGNYRITLADLARYHAEFARRLHAVTYVPKRAPFTKDKGLVSLVEMNILKGGLDLVSMGAGTFHRWLLSEFRQNKKQHSRKGYTISEICPDNT